MSNRRALGVSFIGNRAEREVAADLTRQGKLWFYQPKVFRLPPPHFSYRPDFYVVEEARFYEVVGTRQAYSYQRAKIAAFRQHYSHLTLELINHGAWIEAPKQARVAAVKLRRSGRRALTIEVIESRPLGPDGRAIVAAMRKLGCATVNDLAIQAGFHYNSLHTRLRKTAPSKRFVMAAIEKLLGNGQSAA